MYHQPHLQRLVLPLLFLLLLALAAPVAQAAGCVFFSEENMAETHMQTFPAAMFCKAAFLSTVIPTASR